MTCDAYVRVSRVAGRGGESFISPAEQRGTIEEWARRTGTEIGAWHEDLDYSGGTLNRPGFQAALERCRSGATGGIVAAKLDRLTRSVVGLGTLLAEAREHGFNVVALDLGLDLHSSNGKLVANVLGSVAEWERERRAEDWEIARRSAIRRGIPNGRAPFGYRKRADGRFEVHEPEAALVREVFERRAAGESISQIGRRVGWSHSTTRQRLLDEAYLGVARAGQHRNEAAHEPLVSRELYETARVARSATRPTGETTADRLLVGIARCGGCGKSLKVVRRRRADGSYAVGYFCKDAASEPCPRRAFARAEDLDGLVERFFAYALQRERRFAEAAEAERELDEARRAVADAEAELAAFVTAASALDAELFQRGAEARQARLDLARAALAEVTTRTSAATNVVSGNLADLWQTLTVVERRQILAAYLDRVVVRRAGDADASLDDRVQIVWAGNVVAEPPDKLRAAAA
jgi:site-specific DNA recombinase